MKPVRPDMTQPATKASVRKVPDSANDSASSPFGFFDSVEVTNTMTASGMRMTAIVRNWRLR